jgi:phospholipid/cholesterol/gamma-HCH transport system substrate-binding protein
VVTYLGFTKAIPFRSHWEVQAVFRTSNNIRPNSPVRIAGVDVGKVTSVQDGVGGSSEAVVTMRIAEKGRPLHEDATFTIRPRIFLEGNFFVDVSPGSPAEAELEDGDTVPINQTAAPVQLDQILTALQTDTREDLKTLLREYSSGLAGKGARGFNRSIRHWKPAYRDSAIVSEASLGLVEHDLSNYIRHAGTVAAALDRNAPALKSLITDFNTTAAAFAREDANLRRAIGELPRTLRAGQPALAALNASFPDLRALARELRPGVRSSDAAIEASTPLVAQLRRLVGEDELKGLVGDLEPTVGPLTRLTTSSVDLFKEVRRNASCANEVILPWANDTVPDPNFPATGTVYQETPKPLPGLAAESRSGDGNGQWFRILVAGGTNLITLSPGVFATRILPINGSNPPKPLARPPINADAPCEIQERPDLETVAGIPPPQKRIDVTDPAFQARYAKARDRAFKWMERTLKSEGLADTIKLSDTPATLEQIQELAAAKKVREAATRAKILAREAAR